MERDTDFARIALPFLPVVARLARSLTRDPADSDDLVQDTFLKAYRHWDTFVPDSDCRRWLAAICRNTFYAQRARARWVTAVGDDMELETFAAVQLHKLTVEQGADDLFSRVDLAPAIRRAIEALPESFRSAVELVDVNDLTYEEAAERLQIPVGTVRSRLYRGRRLLQHALTSFALDAGYTSVTRDAIQSDNTHE